jgi:hypothetical protein
MWPAVGAAQTTNKTNKRDAARSVFDRGLGMAIVYHRCTHMAI